MLCVNGISDGYVNFSNGQTAVSILDTFSLHFEILSGGPQGSVLAHFLFNILHKDICSVIKHTNFYYLPMTLKSVVPQIPSRIALCCNLILSVNNISGLLQGGSNMTGTDLYVKKQLCAAAVRP